MNKMKIQEIVIVEGKDDMRRLREVIDADTIETIGSTISEKTLIQIEHAQEARGTITFTDPDLSEEEIRKIIMEAVPQTRHAFLPRTQAKPERKRGLDTEHANDAAILEALKKVVAPDTSQMAASEITRQDLLDYGLITGVQAKEKREKLGDKLRVSYTSDRQLEKHLKMLRIMPKELAQVMKIVEKQHE